MEDKKPTKAVVNKTTGPVKANTEHCDKLRQQLAAAIEKAKAAGPGESQNAYTKLAESLRRQLQDDRCNNTKFRRPGGDGVTMEPMDI